MRAWTEGLRRRGEPGFPDTVRVYTHFSYCESTCSFCMYFHQVPKQEGAYARYVDHLIATIERFHAGAGRARVSSAYVGGGTPSATPHEDLRRYFDAFNAAFEVAGEFTMEAHPRSMDIAKLELAHAHGVNRISMGIQSLEPEVLRSITRKNAPLEAIAELVAAARALGILVNLDLVLGLPGQTIESFRADADRVMQIGADVVTLYRYQTVPQLGHEPPAAMHYFEAFNHEMQAMFERHGYRIGDPVHEGSMTVRLLRHDAKTYQDVHAYSLFDAKPSHLIGLGPGAYGHAFGYGWFRDVTSMDRLDTLERTYWGTRISAVDECRQILLETIASPRPIDLAALRRASGIDVERELAPVFSVLRSAGAVRGDLLVVDGLEGDARERIIDALMPAPPRDPSVPPARYQPELVALRTERREESPDPEIVRAFCEAVGAERGKRLFGAVVRDMDDRSVYFGVRGVGLALRVHVRRPGQGKSFFETARFAISYSQRPGEELRDEERSFLSQLSAAMTAAERS